MNGPCPDDGNEDDTPWGWQMLLGSGVILLVAVGVILLVAVTLGSILWWLVGWWPWL